MGRGGTTEEKERIKRELRSQAGTAVKLERRTCCSKLIVEWGTINESGQVKKLIASTRLVDEAITEDMKWGK